MFLDTKGDLELEQLVKELTHRSDNILDLGIIELSEKIIVIDCVVKSYFSYHKSVMCVFNHVGYDSLQMQEMSFRKLKSINLEEFATYLNFNTDTEEHLDVLIARFGDELAQF